MENGRKYQIMNIQIFGTKKSFDSKKAERYFKERGIKYQFIDMKGKATVTVKLRTTGKTYKVNVKVKQEIISKEGKKINTYKPSGQKEEDSGKRGRKVGIAYELDNGEIIYVPE